MKALVLQFWTEFRTPSGELRELTDPEGPATPRQLRKLNASGCLVVVEPGTGKPITKGEAAYAVSLVPESEPLDGEPPKRWGFN
jgi:hypothetical protein